LGNVVLEEAPYRLESMEGAAGDLPASRQSLAGLARRHSADIIHINGYAHARITADRPVLVVAHSDVLSWWQAVHGEAAPPEWHDYRDEVAAGLTAADRVVAPSRAVLDDLATHYGFARDDALVIRNGIDLAAYRRAAIFAAPARYEPFGLGILEAAASGCALVLGDIPSLRENWEGAAVFVPPGDAAGWRTALRDLSEDEGDRELWAFAAQQRARGFSREA